MLRRSASVLTLDTPIWQIVNEKDSELASADPEDKGAKPSVSAVPLHLPPKGPLRQDALARWLVLCKSCYGM